MMGGWGYGNGWDSGWGIFMVIMMVAVLALIVVGIIVLVRALSRPSRQDWEHPGAGYWQGPPQSSPPQAGQSRALGVLEERYARGEIEREEFLRRRQDILGGGGQ